MFIFFSLYCTVTFFFSNASKCPFWLKNGIDLKKRCSCFGKKKNSYFAHQIVFFHAEVGKIPKYHTFGQRDHIAWYQTWLPCHSGTILSVQTKPLIMFVFLFLPWFYQKLKLEDCEWQVHVYFWNSTCHWSVLSSFLVIFVKKKKTPLYLFFV